MKSKANEKAKGDFLKINQIRANPDLTLVHDVLFSMSKWIIGNCFPDKSGVEINLQVMYDRGIQLLQHTPHRHHSWFNMW